MESYASEKEDRGEENVRACRWNEHREREDKRRELRDQRLCQLAAWKANEWESTHLHESCQRKHVPIVAIEYQAQKCRVCRVVDPARENVHLAAIVLPPEGQILFESFISL